MKFTATKPTKYKGVWYQANDEFDVDPGRDEIVARKHFKATPVPEKKPARRVVSTRALKAEEPEPVPEPKAEAVHSEPVEPMTTEDFPKTQGYRTRRLRAED